MSRSTAAAATAAGRQRTPPYARRLSGPAAPARREVAYPPPRPQRPPARPALRVVAGGAAGIATRVADIAIDVSSSRLMDRLVRSRLWIGVIAFGLIGIVAMQVSMLKLNAGIGRAVETASTLERSNSSLRADVSRLSNGDRIQSLAGARGFAMPAPADVSYLHASGTRADALRAARRMRAPDRAIAGPAGSLVEASAPHVDSLTPEAVAASIQRNAAAQPDGVAAPANTAATTAPATAATATAAAPPAGSQPAVTGATAAPAAAAPASTASPAGGVAPATSAPAP